MIKVRIDGNVVDLPTLKGADGKSAYQYAIEAGFEGTEEEFINLLIQGTDTINTHLTDDNAHSDIRELINSIVKGETIVAEATNAATATNVAWSGVTSKPSYYDAKAIKGITRSGTTFTYTCMDGTTGTFTQQDNNTTYSVVSTTADGLAPKRDGSTTKYLRADGTWAVPPDTNTTYTSLKNPYALTIQGNGTTLTNGTYDGSAAKTVNITPSSIGAAASSHTHSQSDITSYVHSATGTNGTRGYVKIATLKVLAKYQNEPLVIELTRRSAETTCTLYIAFASENSADPALGQFKYIGTNYNCYMYKSATSTWDLYVQKSEAYDDIGVLRYHKSPYMSGVSITWTNALVTTPPTGSTVATIGGSVASASTATKLATARTISLTGSVTGSGSFDGSGNLSIATTTNHTHSYLPLSGGTLTGTLNVTRINPVSALTNNLGTSANPFLSLFTDTVALRGDTSGASYGALNVSTPGTAETTGVSKLVLGNNTASGRESNAKGEITIYGTNTGSTVITAGNNSTSTVALTLPAESGTLALKSQITTLSSVYNVLKQINIKSSGSYNNKVCFVSKNPFSETFNGVTYTGYSTINEAITSEYNSSYTLNIIVLPGTYKEAVNIVNKKINVFGVDKHTCIVTNDEDYNNPPFAICSGNTIANLTIICNDDGSTSYSNLAYCVHMDYDYSGSPITIDNCIMHSYQSACIGFGTRGGSPFYVTNCEMYKHANSRLNSHNSFNNGVVYGHNAYVDQTVSEEIYFINNYMEAETGYSIYIFNANKYYPGGNGGSPDTKLTFVNNTVWSRDETQGIPHKLAPNYLTEVIPSYAYFGGGFIRTFGCAGNNAQFLNYKNSGEPLEIIGWSTAKNGTLTLSDYIGKYNYLFIETWLNSNGSRQNYESKMVGVNNLLNYNPKVQLYSITPSYATTAYYLLNFRFTENQMTISDFEIGSAWNGTSVSYKVSGVY